MARFVTVIACIDGRVQAPLAAWARERFGADYADMITRPGCDSVLSDRAASGGSGDQLRADVEVSVRAHDPVGIVVSGHHDCAANPTTQQHHEEQILRGVDEVRTWVPEGITVVGAYVDESWEARLVA